MGIGALYVFFRVLQSFLSPLFRLIYIKLGDPMFDDDLEPVNKAPKVKNLEPMSVDELESYILQLKAEILRTENEIGRKKAVMEAASSVFK
jgi:uncharacterized small protein (DUF1192 family)